MATQDGSQSTDLKKLRRTSNQFKCLLEENVGRKMIDSTAMQLFRNEKSESVKDSTEYRYQMIEQYFIRGVEEIPQWDLIVDEFISCIISNASSAPQKTEDETASAPKESNDIQKQVDRINKMDLETEIIEWFKTRPSVNDDKSTNGEMWDLFCQAIGYTEADGKQDLVLLIDIMKEICIRILQIRYLTDQQPMIYIPRFVNPP
ncbi:hypothetical protein RFI_10064, partial [Reticulomyxa filosa]